MQFQLDPDVVHVNHGSFGAVPVEVGERQRALRAELEARPMVFFGQRLMPALAEALQAVAGFLGGAGEDWVFVRNATTAMNAVLWSQDLGPGDEVLTTSHRYEGVAHALSFFEKRTGARVVTRHVPFPKDPDELADAVVAAITGRTKLLVIDHIASITSMVFPVQEIAARVRQRGVRVAVDAAHVPGQIPVDVEALGVDYWAGNLHKWAFAPKGTAVLWTRPALQESLVHPVASLGYGGTLHERFHWVGTDDPTGWLCAPEAVALAARGYSERAERNHALVQQARQMLAHRLGTPLPHPDDARLYAAMATVALPRHDLDGVELRRRLSNEHGVDVLTIAWDGRLWCRVSGQIYNQPQDYERLADALVAVLR